MGKRRNTCQNMVVFAFLPSVSPNSLLTAPNIYASGADKERGSMAKNMINAPNSCPRKIEFTPSLTL
jgi:hypothetical protein